MIRSQILGGGSPILADTLPRVEGSYEAFLDSVQTISTSSDRSTLVTQPSYSRADRAGHGGRRGRVGNDRGGHNGRGGRAKVVDFLLLSLWGGRTYSKKLLETAQ